MNSASKWCLGSTLFLASFCAFFKPVAAADAPASNAIDAVWPSPFGMGSCAARSKDLDSWIPQMTEIGIHNIRGTSGTGWRGVPTTSFTSLDNNLDYLRAHNVVSGGIFFVGRGKDKRGFPLDDLPGWTDHVTAMVGHTKGKIVNWELWNEPPNGTGKQTAADYAKYVVASYDAAKKANPDCLIGLSAKSVHINYLDQAIAAGAKNHFDYITLHPYETFGTSVNVPGFEPVFMSIVPTLRKMLAARNPEKINAPVILTEIGMDAGKQGPEKQARAIVKCYTMGIAQGMTCIQWFEGRDGDSGPMGIITAKGDKRPSYFALGALIKALGQRPTYVGWLQFNDKHYGFVFQGEKGPVLVTWARVGTTDEIDLGESLPITDTVTQKSETASKLSLGENPLIVEGVPAKLLSLAKENKTKPFPWGGDYTSAKSVSITYGEKTEEKGLHTRAGDQIAADVLAYGGNARVGNLPGGQAFLVDPNFLSYTPTPIEIAIVCRRNPKNEPAKIHIEYEAPPETKKTTELEIPDNKDWYTAKWKITDAQFVSMYGFNFRIDTGKYYIQSVTVTKLDK